MTDSIVGNIMYVVQPDRRFIADLYEQYSDKLYRFIVWHVSDPDAAEDVVAEVFVRAWKHREQLEASAHHQAWLYKVAKNLIIDTYRKRPTEQFDDTLPIESAENLEEQAAADDDSRRLREAVARLPGDLQTVVVLRFFEHMSAQEVADTLGKSAVHIRVMQHRALKLLRSSYIK